jgi:large subunit ribosomal protein L10e
VLFDALGETGYKIHLRVYPHVILRENRMIATAGADRLQEGMRRSFGKPTGRAARIKTGQSILDIYVNSNAVDTAKEALRVGSTKLPVACVVNQETLAVPVPAA